VLHHRACARQGGPWNTVADRVFLAGESGGDETLFLAFSGGACGVGAGEMLRRHRVKGLERGNGGGGVITTSLSSSCSGLYSQLENHTYARCS
jgi:hypothetical protein